MSRFGKIKSFKGYFSSDKKQAEEVISGPSSNGVLFVCSSNTVVSQIAEAIFNERSRDKKAISAGFVPSFLTHIPAGVKKVCKRQGIDLSGHNVTSIEDIAVDSMELVLTSTREVRDKLKMNHPNLKIFTIKEYVGYWDDCDIAEPFNGTVEDYETCFNEIEDLMFKILDENGQINEPVPIRNFKYLDDLIHSQADEILLDAIIVLGDDEEFKQGILIDDDGIVIDGNDFVIDACDRAEIFRISAKDVTIRNLRFKNGHSLRGGAIYVDDDASLTIENCYFEGNSASNGGVIYNQSPLNIICCTFKGNSSERQGGVIYNQGSSDISFSNCTFCENSSRMGIYGRSGGVIYSEHQSFAERFSTLDFENCRFIQNSGHGGGGAAICLWESNLDMTGCIFNSNSGSSAIYCDKGSFKLKNCDFNGNKSGAISNSSKSLSSMDDCTFTENSEGVVYCDGGSLLNINGCTFSKNFSESSGAVIYNRKGDLTFRDCCFNNNESLKSAGSIYNSANISLFDCTFENNCATEDGGDICNFNLINIHDSEFISNKDNRNVIFQSDGEDCTLTVMGSDFTSSNEVLHVENGFISVDDSKFNISGDKYGICSKKAVLLIIKSKFSPGKVIFCDNVLELEEKSDIESQIVFGENFKSIRYLHSDYPADYKGFKYLDELISCGSDEIGLECDVKIHDLEKNFYEGGVELDGDMIIDGHGHVIDANHLSRAFIITSGNVTLKNIIFKNGKHFKNHFLDDSGGGAILALPSSKVTIEDCQFVDNDSRQNAGAIYNKSFDSKISNSKFANNSSQNRGGVILTDGSLILKECDFTSNSSKWGGAICNKHILECDGTSFKDNCSQKGAGAIYNQKGNFKLEHSSFTGNYSQRGEGGAIYNDNDAFIKLHDCSFLENRSVFVDGGAIYNGGDLNCNACHFDCNNAYHQGGAIGNGGSANLTNSDFKQNSALFGGAIFIKWDLLKCEDCSFEDNSAKYSGNELYIVQNGSLELKNCSPENLDIYHDDEPEY
jgi:protein-tyrosine-phosphatase